MRKTYLQTALDVGAALLVAVITYLVLQGVFAPIGIEPAGETMIRLFTVVIGLASSGGGRTRDDRSRAGAE